MKLISQQKIQKMLPQTDSFDPQSNQSGFWYELTDDEKHLLRRQIMDNPFNVDIEVFSDKPEEPTISRHELTEIRGTFTIVIPDIAQAKNFDFFSSPVLSEGIKGLQKPAINIFHLDLKVSESEGPK